MIISHYIINNNNNTLYDNNDDVDKHGLHTNHNALCK